MAVPLLLIVTVLAPTAARQSPDTGCALTLVQMLDSVARQHPALRVARAHVAEARGSRSGARSLGNPMLVYQVENAALPGQARPPMDREVTLAATLPLEPLYQRWPRLSGANADLRAAEADLNAERQAVSLGAARAFYRVAQAQVELEAARDLAAWLDTVVGYNHARVREGLTAGADLIRSELERDRAGADATMKDAELARARADLAAYLGATGPAHVLRVAPRDLPLALPDTIATAEAHDGRPEVRAARERVTAAGAAVAAARTGLISELRATVGVKRTAGSTSLLAGLGLPFPLFDQNRGDIARAAAQREAARFALDLEERRARADLIGTSQAARLLTARIEQLGSTTRGEPFLARGEEVRRIALGAYREGAIPLIQVIDAARTWGDARVVYHEVLYAQHLSILEMVVAQGRDLAATLPALTRREETGR